MSNNGLAKDPLNIVVCGVGGQGNVLVARLIGRAHMAMEYFVTVGETYGASQRGGDVMSHVRISAKRSLGPLIPQGMADIVVGLEPMETLRNLRAYGNPQVCAVVNDRPVYPVMVGANSPRYPDPAQLRRALPEVAKKVWYVPATEMALGLGSTILANVIMMGALIGTGLVPASMERVEQTLREHFSAAQCEINVKALRAGMDVVSQTS